MSARSSFSCARFSPARIKAAFARPIRRLLSLFDVRNHISSYVFVSIFLSVVIISTILIFAYSFTVLDDISQSSARSGKNVVDTIGEQIDSYADSLAQTNTLLFSSEDIRAYLKDSSADMPSYEWFRIFNDALDVLTFCGRNQYNLISGMRLDKNKNEFLLYGGFNAMPDPSAYTPDELNRMIFYKNHAFYVSAFSVGSTTPVYLCTQLYDSAIDSLCQGLVMPDSALVLLDEQDNIYRQYASDKGGRAQLEAYLSGRTSALPANLQYVEHHSDKTGMTVVMILSSIPLSQKLAAVIPYLLPLALFALIAGFLLSYLLSRKVKRGFTVMENNIQLVEKRAYSEVTTIPTPDEFGHLSRTFAHMASHIDALIEENQQRARATHELELQVLRAQISPHFLYNALNSVRSLANLQGMDHIERLITAIIRLLRATLSSTETLVSLDQELEYVRNYIEICQYQYLNDFTIDMDVDQALLPCRMPPMVLQPIVENAIIHGIADFRSDGVIRITAQREGDMLLLCVTDNGQGMSAEQIDALLSQSRNTDKRRFSSIGVHNVLKRIQMRFGEAYGLRIFSRPGEYTSVEIRLPYLAKERSE